MISTLGMIKKTAVSTRFLDFWFLGGASIILFFTMSIGNIFKATNPIIQQKFLLIGPAFGLFSILCNDPHFMISYKFGYTRGVSFLKKYWFSLVVLPLAMLALYSYAYFFYEYDISQWQIVIRLNQILEFSGMSFRFGVATGLGQEILGLSIWAMYLTVGWHYSKQVYGVLMVYNEFDHYGLIPLEKIVIRLSLLSLAAFQFLHLSKIIDASKSGNMLDTRFPGVQMQNLDMPNWLYLSAEVLAIISFALVCLVFLKRFFKDEKMPSLVFITVWLSIYVWWIQFLDMPEFYYLTVPFFHSLQYLPFAYRMERKTMPTNDWLNLRIGLRVVILMVIGFLAFEIIPWILDQGFDTEVTKTAWFFSTSIVVFINIHHFFIDSVVWRLGQKEVKAGLFPVAK